MKPLDKNYLSLQFKNKIHSKNGSEFQTFFESIMEKAYSDFQKIKPYGKAGDAGNDGYRKEAGIYYQVYAPNVPSIKEAEAAKKLKEDFHKLKKVWDKISHINRYYFVFNDKYSGSTIDLEGAITELEVDKPNIKFDPLLAKNLEEIFFTLSAEDFLNLGFNVDSRQAISIGYDYLQKVEIELDRENAILALKVLENMQDSISLLADEGLLLEYELLECRCLQKLEKVREAKTKYENIATRYPDDPRATLYLAEILLLNEELEKNKQLLERAGNIDKNHWLLELEMLVRKSHIGERIDPSVIDDKDFPTNPRIKSNFYRLYTHFLFEAGDKVRAHSFIERAIKINPDRFSNYVAKLAIIEMDIFLNQVKPDLPDAAVFLKEIETTIEKFESLGDIGNRNRAILNLKKINALRLHEKYDDVLKLSEETFGLLLSCYFNKQIDDLLVTLLFHIQIPLPDLEKFLNYLDNTEKTISDNLSKVLITQFNAHNILLGKGKEYFRKKKKEKYIDFVNDLERKNFDSVINFIINDIPFAISFAHSLKIFPDLRTKIIETLPDDPNIQKDKLLLLINCDENNMDDAFEFLKQMDLSKLTYFDCKKALKVAHEKRAWDFEIIILQKLLQKESKKQAINNLKLRLFNANVYLERHLEVIRLGKEILEEDSRKNILDSKNKEILLAQMITSNLKRNENSQALMLIENYPLQQPTFEFIVGIKAEVYIKNNMPTEAIKAIIEGVKSRKVISQEDYARLFYYLTQIENILDFDLKSLGNVQENVFVKLKKRERWYYIGEGNSLDATPITKVHNQYALFIDKSLNDKIIFKRRYGSAINEDKITHIFPIDKYIFWQASINFQELTIEERWKGSQAIEVLDKDGNVDTRYLKAYFKELDKPQESLFEMYYKKKLPFAMLAVSEGGVTNAIGRIQNENKGYINFSTGGIQELELQKEVARKVIEKKLPFYLDGTSALVLSEIGL